MINDPTMVFELPGHVAVAVTTKLLAEGLFNVLNYHLIFWESFPCWFKE
jgi:hypothetical protein